MRWTSTSWPSEVGARWSTATRGKPRRCCGPRWPPGAVSRWPTRSGTTSPTRPPQLTELRSSVLADRIEADLALGEGASLVGELRALLSADPLAERPRALLMRALYAAGRQAEALEVYQRARELLAAQLGVDPSTQLEQVYLRILRGEEGVPAVATAAGGP